MPIATLIIAALVMLFGFRLVTVAFRSAVSGAILVRRGTRREWQPAPTRNDAWKSAARDGMMGLLLIVLGVVLLV